MVTDNEATELYLNNPINIVSGGTKRTESERDGGWTRMLVFVSITCAMGSAFPAGYNIGVINNPQHLMKEFCNQSIYNRYNVALTTSGLDVLWSAVVSIFLIGGVTGSLSAGWLANKLGRKGAIGAGNICGIVGAILFLLVKAANSVEILMAGRLVVGLSGGLATSLVPMYMTEAAPLALRGAVGVICQLGICLGVLAGQILSLEWTLGVEELWHFMFAAFSPFCMVSLGLMFILPESPKYLYITKGQHRKAVHELTRLRNKEASLLEAEVAGLNEEAAAVRRMETWSSVRVLKDPTLRLPLILVCCMQCGQQLSGINAVFNYSTDIFRKANLDDIQSQYATLGSGVINVVMALIAVRLMSMFGRRTLFLISCICSIVCLVFFTFAILYLDASPVIPWLCMIALLTYVLVYGIGLGPIPYFIGSELFDVGPRPAAMSLGSVGNWGGNFLVAMTFPSLQSSIGSFSFLIFAAFTTLLAILIRIYLPETRGRDTLAITSTMTRGFKSRPNHVSS